MNDDWKCPMCGAEYDSGNYPDQVYDNKGQFEFECEDDTCFHVFTVEVEWYPSFRVRSSPAPDEAGKR
jgi:hypothetical protein